VSYSPGLNNPTAGPIPVTGPLTDAELRASPVEMDQVAFSSALSNQINVTTAGTRVALGASTVIKSVIVRAKLANTGIIYVGDSTVTSLNGFQLDRGATVTINIDNLSKVFIDSSVSGEGVSYLIAVA
jgi:hypothetical protein